MYKQKTILNIVKRNPILENMIQYLTKMSACFSYKFPRLREGSSIRAARTEGFESGERCHLHAWCCARATRKVQSLFSQGAAAFTLCFVTGQKEQHLERCHEAWSHLVFPVQVLRRGRILYWVRKGSSQPSSQLLMEAKGDAL